MREQSGRRSATGDITVSDGRTREETITIPSFLDNEKAAYPNDEGDTWQGIGGIVEDRGVRVKKVVGFNETVGDGLGS